jgi:hypothetical protein
MSMQLESNLELRLEIAERKADALVEVKHYLERYEFQHPRDASDRDWQRGARWIIEQTLALIEQAGGA